MPQTRPVLTSPPNRTGAPSRLPRLVWLLAFAALSLAPACDDDPAESGDVATDPTSEVTPDSQPGDDTPGDQPDSDTPADEAAAAAVSATALRDHVDVLAADDTDGRLTGSPGHAAARDYVAAQLESAGLEPFGDDGTWLDVYATTPSRGRYQRQGDGSVVENDTDTGWNVVGLLRGTDEVAAEEYVVVMAHYDHLGVSQDGSETFNGAFDDASGVASALEIARVLVAADARPRRSVIFLITDQEEHGLTGAARWLADAPVPLDDIVVGLSLDPLGRGLLPDYGPIVLMGLEMSPELSAYWRQTQAFTARDVGFLAREMIPVYASDQDRFYEQEIPAIWVTTPGMSFYHTVDDDPETIDYAVLRDVTRYLTRCVLLVANGDERFEYVGPPELDATHAADAAALLEGLLTTEVITATERARLEGYRTDLETVAETGDWSVVGSPLLYFGEVLTYVAFQLPARYPGEVPPPFPTD